MSLQLSIHLLAAVGLYQGQLRITDDVLMRQLCWERFDGQTLQECLSVLPERLPDYFTIVRLLLGLLYRVKSQADGIR